MTLQIPKIIHQIWSGIDKPLPKISQLLGSTWKRDYPDWEYVVWDNAMMNKFINDYYPQYWDVYNSFTYNIQRWDIMRYLILDKIGGMYVDFDYESIRPLDKLIEGKVCCFSEEPESHKSYFPIKSEQVFNNALILSIPNHPFMKKIIESVFSKKDTTYDINSGGYVLDTTGPWRLINLYKNLSIEEKNDIFVIPAKYVSPFDKPQSNRFIKDKERSTDLEECLNEAYAVHYFFGHWSNEVRDNR